MNGPDRREPIAIIGIGCRLPGADGPDALWRLLVEGRHAIGEIPRDRFDVDALYDERPATPGRIMTRWGGFLDGIDRFDAQFFGMSAREADRLDPQQRLLLEVGWEALEDAGQSLPAMDTAHTGVFVGTWLNDYESRLFRDPSAIDFYMTTGTGRYSASGRLSYMFGFEGPSITIDCACSSSLVAVHLACHSLWSGESSVALAGGSNVILEPYIHIAYSQSRMMAPDGRCKFGDARADGYVRSEGAAIVVLKPLSRAIADGDPVYAIIVGSAVNNDGRSSGFLTTPGQAGQETMLRRAYADAGVSPSSCQYVEAHGTGTRAGDPVEIGAIGAVLGAGRGSDDRCLVGSVKTNIGHTEGAAGVSGLIKVALSLRHGHIPPSLHCVTPNPGIPWSELGVEVNTSLRKWAPGVPAIAGVSSFGIAGTNAHIVVQEAPRTEPPAGKPSGPFLVALSGHTPEALKALASSWLTFLESAPSDVAVRDIAYTATARRTHQDVRLALVAANRAELLQQVQAYTAGQTTAGLVTGTSAPDQSHKTVFVFPGQGSQWLGMGRRLLAEQPVFRDAIQACDVAVRQETGWSVIEELQAEPAASRLTQIDVIQPVLFSVQVALAALWRHWGVEPAAVVGHSMGEVAASYVAGVLSIEDAARVICRRSRLLKRTSGKGAMAVIGLSFDDTAAAIAGLEDRLSIAVSNSARSTVVSGDPGALDAVIATLEARDIFCRRVKVDVASHSPQMDPLRADLLDALQQLRPRSGSVPMFSTVRAQAIDGAECDAAYWVENLRQPVLFSTAVKRLIDAGHDTFVEMSPHPLLASSVQEIFQDAKAEGLVVGSLARDEDDVRAISMSVAGLWAAGRRPALTRIVPAGRVIPLPTYPFQRERHWLEVATRRRTPASSRSDEMLLGAPVSSPVPSFELECDPAVDDWTNQVRYAGISAIPAGVLITMASAVIRHHRNGSAAALTRLSFSEPFVPLSEGRLALQTVITRTAPAGGAFGVFRHSGLDSGSQWIECVSGEFGPAGLDESPAPEVDTIRARGAHQDGAAFYQTLQGRGVDVRDDARTVREVRATDTQLLAQIHVGGSGDHRLARVVEACVQLLAVQASEAPEFLRVPERIQRIAVGDRVDDITQVLVTRDADRRTANIVLVDDSGRVCGRLDGIAMRRVRTAVAAGAVRAQTAAWMYDLVWEPVAPGASDPSQLTRTFIVLGADSEIGEAVAAALDANGGCAIRVHAGSTFARQAERVYTVDPLSAGDYERLMLDAGQNAALPFAGIVQLWPAPTTHTAGALMTIRAVQGLERASAAAKLWIVTRGAQAARTGETPDVAQALLWGSARGLALEHPQFFGGILDLDPAASIQDNVDAVLACCAGRTELQAAIRGGQWLAPRLVAAATIPARRVPIHRDGAYIVTGGLGRLGLQVARWLAEEGAGDIVLMGRRGVPPREEWDDLPARSDAGRQTRAIALLERLGARVTVVAADSADADAMRQLFARFNTSLPPLRGIVHAAGRIDYRPLAQIGAAELDDVCRAKVQGTLVLHELTRGGQFPLDFFVLFSSGASVWGSRHLLHYSAANAALDAIAHARRTAGLPATAINWGWWEGGATTADAESLFAQAGLRRMATDDALAAMADAIAGGTPQRVVAAFDWDRFKRIFESTGSRLLDRIETTATEPATAQPRGTLLRDLQQLPAADVRARLFDFVRANVAAVVGRDAAQLDVTRGFFKLGMDSLMTVELRRRLEAALDRALPATIAFEYPNIIALSSFLESQVVVPESAAPAAPAATQPDAIEALLDGESDDELALMLESELSRVLSEEERRN